MGQQARKARADPALENFAWYMVLPKAGSEWKLYRRNIYCSVQTQNSTQRISLQETIVYGTKVQQIRRPELLVCQGLDNIKDDKKGEQREDKIRSLW